MLNRNIGPYRFQRDRARLGRYPRPAQPNINQPNQKPVASGWGQGSKEYWQKIFENYLKRKVS